MEEESPRKYIPAGILADADLATYDWTTQSPTDIMFFSGPLEEGDVPSAPRYIQEDWARPMSTTSPELPAIIVSEAPAPVEAPVSGRTSGETMVPPSISVSPKVKLWSSSQSQAEGWLCKANWTRYVKGPCPTETRSVWF